MATIRTSTKTIEDGLEKRTKKIYTKRSKLAPERESEHVTHPSKICQAGMVLGYAGDKEF